MQFQECLPVMGGCQVSTILQNLDTSDPQNLNLIIPPSELRAPPVDSSYNVQSNYIIIKDNAIVRKEKCPPLNNDILKDEKKKDNFEDMLYFVCNLCPFLCTQDSKITEHLENAHKSNTFIKLPELKCPACINVFYHRMSLRSHLIHDHGVGNSDLTRIIQAVSYYSTKHKNKQKMSRHTTQVIRKSLETKTDITDISDVSQTYDMDKCDIKHQEEEKVVLPQVDIAQNNSEKIISTLMKQTSPVGKYGDSKKANSCIISGCKARLQAMDKMTYHLNSHFENGFRCNECGERFLCWKPLTSHLWRLHKVNMELFACDKCDYKTVSLAKLNNIHKLIHGEARAYTCNICDKSFKNVKQLRNHKFLHREKTKHSCPECLKSFSYRGQLKIHMDMVHKKLKPFSCNLCGYKGSSKTSLKMHSRQHTGRVNMLDSQPEPAVSRFVFTLK